MALYFYDSHGNMWVTCHANEEGAEAFGPRGTAKRHREGLSWSVAVALGLVTRDDSDQGEGWDTFEPDKLERLMRKTLAHQFRHAAERESIRVEIDRLLALGMMDYPE